MGVHEDVVAGIKMIEADPEFIAGVEAALAAGEQYGSQAFLDEHKPELTQDRIYLNFLYKEVHALRTELLAARLTLSFIESLGVVCCRCCFGAITDWGMVLWLEKRDHFEPMCSQGCVDKVKAARDVVISELPGIDITGGMDSVEYVRRMRSGEPLDGDSK